jgi:hypothetical protein
MDGASKEPRHSVHRRASEGPQSNAVDIQVIILCDSPDGLRRTRPKPSNAPWMRRDCSSRRAASLFALDWTSPRTVISIDYERARSGTSSSSVLFSFVLGKFDVFDHHRIDHADPENFKFGLKSVERSRGVD